MQKLNIRFGPINPMTRKIYYKKIKAAKEGDSEQNWHLFGFRALMIVGVFSLTFYYFSQLKFSASLSGMEFSTDDEPESVSDRPSSAQNSKQNGHTSTQRPPKVAFFRCIFKRSSFDCRFLCYMWCQKAFSPIWKKNNLLNGQDKFFDSDSWTEIFSVNRSCF